MIIRSLHRFKSLHGFRSGPLYPEKSAAAAAVMICLLFLSACSMIPQADTAGGTDRPDPAGTVQFLPSEVVICTGTLEGGGTLFRTEKALYVVSAAHLLESFDDDSAVCTIGGTALTCTPVRIDETVDLGILAVAGKVPEQVLKSAVALPAGTAGTDSRQEAGEDTDDRMPAGIICCTADHSGLVTGYITDRDLTIDEAGAGNDHILLLLAAEEGMSGNGIYDEAGEYRGMLTGAFDGGAAVGIGADTVQKAIDSLDAD